MSHAPSSPPHHGKDHTTTLPQRVSEASGSDDEDAGVLKLDSATPSDLADLSKMLKDEIFMQQVCLTPCWLAIGPSSDLANPEAP